MDSCGLKIARRLSGQFCGLSKHNRPHHPGGLERQVQPATPARPPGVDFCFPQKFEPDSHANLQTNRNHSAAARENLFEGRRSRLRSASRFRRVRPHRRDSQVRADVPAKAGERHWPSVRVAARCNQQPGRSATHSQGSRHVGPGVVRADQVRPPLAAVERPAGPQVAPAAGWCF